MFTVGVCGYVSGRCVYVCVCVCCGEVCVSGKMLCMYTWVVCVFLRTQLEGGMEEPRESGGDLLRYDGLGCGQLSGSS